MRSHEALKKAVEQLGSFAELSRVCNVKYAVAYNWYHRNKSGLPPEHVLKIEKLTGISRHDLRPDVFGEADHESTK